MPHVAAVSAVCFRVTLEHSRLLLPWLEVIPGLQRVGPFGVPGLLFFLDPLEGSFSTFCFKWGAFLFGIFRDTSRSRLARSEAPEIRADAARWVGTCGDRPTSLRAIAGGASGAGDAAGQPTPQAGLAFLKVDQVDQVDHFGGLFDTPLFRVKVKRTILGVDFLRDTPFCWG